jgi:hypothetical protein
MSERIAPRTWYTEAVIGTNVDGLSNEIDGKGYRLAKIFMPNEWTAADITFVESQRPGGPFNDLYDDASGSDTEISVDVSVLAGTAIPIDASAPASTVVPVEAPPPAETKIAVAASKTIIISENKNKLTAMTYFKVRSGTSAVPVPQTAERTIGLLFVGI